jgi:cation-transporting ATPase 13A1
VNIKGVHKAHALFGGTRVLQVTSAEKKEQLDNDKDDDDDVDDEEGATKEKPLLEETVEVSDTLKKEEDLSGVRALPPTPDGGCLCYCTRTGFSSSQGKLVRMIENSTSTVRGDVRDTVLLLLFLLIFAVSASGYVLVEG